VAAGLTTRFQPLDSPPKSILACLKVLQDVSGRRHKLPIEEVELPVEGEI